MTSYQASSASESMAETMCPDQRRRKVLAEVAKLFLLASLQSLALAAAKSVNNWSTVMARPAAFRVGRASSMALSSVRSRPASERRSIARCASRTCALDSSVSFDWVRVAARSSPRLASASDRVEKYIFPALPAGLRYAGTYITQKTEDAFSCLVILREA